MSYYFRTCVRKNNAAFSFIELLIALSIIGILFAISLPMVQPFLARAQDDILQKQILSAITFAQHEARARHAAIVLRYSANNQIIFLNANEDGVLTDESQIISQRQTSTKHGEINWRSFPHYRQYLLFSPTGMLQADNGTFWHCHAGLPSWAIMISKTGRTRVMYPDEDKEIKDGVGNAYNCQKSKFSTS